MKTPEFITVLDLYAYAKDRNLLEARIRICDGMAVSYYPDPRAISAGRYEIILDVSANEPIGFDDLDSYAQRQTDHPELDALDQYAADQYAADRPIQNANFRRDVEADRRRSYLQRRRVSIESNESNEFPWAIYGYYGHRRK